MTKIQQYLEHVKKVVLSPVASDASQTTLLPCWLLKSKVQAQAHPGPNSCKFSSLIGIPKVYKRQKSKVTIVPILFLIYRVFHGFGHQE